MTSDHSALLTTIIAWKVKQIKQIVQKMTKWELLVQDLYKDKYNIVLALHLESKDSNLDVFCHTLTEAGKEVLSENNVSDSVQFKYSKDNLLPIIKEQNRLLLEA